MRDIISPFADREAVEFLFGQHPALKSLAQEFCAAFKDVSVAQDRHGTVGVSVLMNNGIEVGKLRAVAGGEFYTYSSPHLVKKAKKSARSEKDTRDAKTITGLIKAVIKNNEQPRIEPVYKSFERAVRYAFHATGTTKDVYVEMSHEMRAYMVKRFVEGDKYPRDPVRDSEVEKLYDNIVAREREQHESRKNIVRFSKGCKLIGISEINHEKGEYAYYVGSAMANLDGKFQVDKVVISDIQRRSDIFSDPSLVADMTIIKAYMETKPDTGRNAFGVPFRDEYYSDIDVATGYENREMLWVLIPNEADGS